MSLNSISFRSLVYSQYIYKLKSYIGLFNSLVVLQLLAILFALGGSGMSGTSGYGIRIDVNYYSADLVIIFTILWAFFSSILMTTRSYQEESYTFVTNRLSNNLSNIAVILTMSIISGSTALLSKPLMKVVLYVIGDTFFIEAETAISRMDQLSGIIATILYILLAGSIGYLIGTVTQMHRLLTIIVPVVFIGILVAFDGEGQFTSKVTAFYYQETSILLFSAKMVVTIALLCSAATLLSNRKEVRQ
ncbi:hypothetical protein JUJ52_17260 [Virgibacillus sp. AGTR]|uniref:hypothetical protein n=1 Tax=unclassified Virgibacillus TaxID=2620237 RepID=UPI001966AEA4|nr:MULTISPECIES: hypothetical protein [unclassified Virgibacillus]MCC2251706.1 hypothetical protein [Virgibacillus sp. AGTR]MDY7043761.1 hypothetical protein [Virgibacillus sp. M23]QRZ19424.1 hypothetical protein JUJ52_07025 [Virgibacillus sp. AGTR]